jgi:GTP-binding protein HflX
MRFHSQSVEEHREVPLPDQGRFEALVQHWTERERPQRFEPGRQNACYVVSLCARGAVETAQAQHNELLGLVEAQGDRVVGHATQALVRPDRRTLLSKGVAERVAAEARALGADLLVVDAELTPSQARNLEDATGLAVTDREAVILNVFERNARTRRARIQVELAHLEYLRPRIRGIGLNMDQQAGGLVARGPGETASELLARKLDGRVAHLRSALEQLRRSDAAQRKHRAHTSRIALVGYTNAGKTSLMNALAETHLSVRDRPFETLDATSRCISRHGGDVLLSDTVGFIRRLPERLFESFESTLAEVSEATLLLVVVDVSDPEFSLHVETTDTLLHKLGAGSIQRYYVFNKADRLTERAPKPDLGRFTGVHPYAVLSSQDAAAVALLRTALLEQVRVENVRRRIYVAHENAQALRLIYSHCRVLHAQARERGTRFIVEGKSHVVDRITKLARERRP